jgi:hypothetical protein
MTQAAALCGAATVQCLGCPHHWKLHDKTTGKCSVPACRCKAFDAKPCQKAPSKGRTRCRRHGGASLVGPAHPNFRTGRHSKVLKGGLAQVYQTAINDPHLVSVRDELALIDMRVAQLLEAIGETGNAKLLKEIRAKFDVFKAAGKKKGKQSAIEGLGALEQVDRLIDEALTAAATWDELRETLDLRRKLSETETRRMRDLHQLIDVKSALAMMTLLVDEVRKRVKDPAVLAALSAQFVRFAGGGSSEDART